MKKFSRPAFANAQQNYLFENAADLKKLFIEIASEFSLAKDIHRFLPEKK